MSRSAPRVIIIGAGFNGVIVAKTYLKINPSADILLIEENDGVGGVWSASRVYPGLIYEVPAPLLNFSDFDMCNELGVDMWSDVSGYQVNEFLVRYARKHDIEKRCRFNTRALNAERDGAGWKVTVRGIDSGTSETLTCDKLIVSTGVTSSPKEIDYDVSRFDGVSFHAVQMGRRHKELVTNDIKNVVVVGGHKSALEAVGTCAQAGKQVEWLVKEGGGGPTWMMPSKKPDGSSLAKMSTKRFLSAMGPKIYSTSSWLDRFLHSTKWWLGTWIQAWFWVFMTKTIKRDLYTKSENGKKLEPQVDNFFWWSPGGTITHDRDLETLRLVDEGKLIRVSRAHMVSAIERSVSLSTGERIPCDAIVFCIGWQLSAPQIFSPSLANEIGIPVDPSVLSEQEKMYWEKLDTAAEIQYLETYPALKNPPAGAYIPTDTKTPFRLFRSIVPPKLAARGENSLVILGTIANARVQLSSELSSLWAVAYMEGLLPEPTKSVTLNEEEMNKDVAHMDAFRRKRYLNSSPYRLTAFETSEIDDLLMTDLGLRADRKRMKIPGGWRGLFGLRAWVEEWFGSYFASDYEGMIDEFLASVKMRERGG